MTYLRTFSISTLLLLFVIFLLAANEKRIREMVTSKGATPSSLQNGMLPIKKKPKVISFPDVIKLPELGDFSVEQMSPPKKKPVKKEKRREKREVAKKSVPPKPKRQPPQLKKTETASQETPQQPTPTSTTENMTEEVHFSVYPGRRNVGDRSGKTTLRAPIIDLLLENYEKGVSNIQSAFDNARKNKDVRLKNMQLVPLRPSLTISTEIIRIIQPLMTANGLNRATGLAKLASEVSLITSSTSL